MTAQRTNGAPTEWDAEAYSRLGRPQTDWGRSVLGTIVLRGDERVIDAGCGTGRLAAELAERLPSGVVIGIDRSANMLAVAEADLRARFGRRVAVVRADLSALPIAGSVDLVFSTAAFHWVLDHDTLFVEIYRALRPGGWLVAQCGGGPNLSRILSRAERVMQTAAYCAHFEGWTGPWLFADASTTARRLTDAGFVEVDTEVIEAPTVLGDRREYTDFLAAVVLRAHLDRLPSPELRSGLLEPMADAGARDDPPFSLDYRRLNLRGRRPG